MTKNTIVSHGVEVVPGKIAASPLAVERNKKYSSNSHYDGSWGEVIDLVHSHWDNWEPGVGAVDGDTRLVHLPADGFFTTIARITDENYHLIERETRPRREGEIPVTTRFIRGPKVPAARVKVVLYRADVLAQDSDRSSDAEWEIVTILADPDYDVPMHPNAMERNYLRHPGGTYREYTDEQWAEARNFWANHVYVRELDPRTEVLEFLSALKREPLEEMNIAEATAFANALSTIAASVDDRLAELSGEAHAD